MKPLYLVGAGGLGLTALEIHRAGGLDGYRPVAWLDDAYAEGDGPAGLPVAGGRDVLERLDEEAAVLVTIGDDRVRLQLTQRALSLGHACPVAVHPRAILFEQVVLGPGSLVNAGAILARSARLGTAAVVNLGATVGHDVVAGDGVQISPGVNVAGAVRFGDGVFVGPGAVVIQGRTVGEWSRVGAGAVVIRDVEPHVTVFGNPARVVDRRAPHESAE